MYTLDVSKGLASSGDRIPYKGKFPHMKAFVDLADGYSKIMMPINRVVTVNKIN